MSLAGLAQETLAIVERGSYQAPSGRTVELRAAVEQALRGTRLYRPEELAALVRATVPRSGPSTVQVEVSAETTAAAGRRLAEVERVPRVAALNFASARNPGGGFLGGAKAQEEDLARCSALYPCQLRARPYYDANRACRSLLYTHHLIYSPEVPFFRDDALELVEQPYCVSMLTAPAPNAGALRREDGGAQALQSTLEERAEMVLAVAAEHGHRTLVLGAWGCGVFRNDPRRVAATFGALLERPPWSTSFERAVFAIYDRSKDRATLAAFADRFGAPRSQ